MEPFVSSFHLPRLKIDRADDDRDGTFQLILSVVTSKMKLQIKQGAKAKVSPQL